MLFVSIEAPPHSVEQFEDQSLSNRAPERYQPFTASEHILQEAEVLESQLLIGSLNDVYRLKLDNGTPEGQLAIYKGVNGEREGRGNARPGTYYKRERAAYVLDQALGFGLVPTTVIREIDGQLGSLQEYVSALPSWEIEDDDYVDGLYVLWGFDYLIFNPDRNHHNVLFRASGTGHGVVAIDHGPAFAHDTVSPYATFKTQLAPPWMIEKLTSFEQNRAQQQETLHQLSAILTPAEASACISRVLFLGQLLREQGMIGRGKLLDKDNKFCYDPRQGGLI
jgi:hypothetical protein